MTKKNNAIAHKKRTIWKELRLAFLTSWEYLRASVRYRKIAPAVTVFGSARFEPDHPYSKMAEQIGAELAKNGLTCITGGGPGIMQAAHRGSHEAGGVTAGANIVLPFEEKANPHMQVSFEFSYFFIRKVMLTKYSHGFIIFPGGFGTMDELFEVATLVQTKRLRTMPVILMGVEFWTPLLEFLKQSMVTGKTISPEDTDYFTLTDSVEEAITLIKKHA
jgi:uncharacterized protein (TIGR00730 family)